MLHVKRFFLFIVLFLISIPCTAFSEDLRVLLPKLLNEHELIKAAEDRRDAAVHRLREAYGGWYPEVNLAIDAGGDFIRFKNDKSTSELKNTQTLRGTQLITDFGATSSGVQRVREELDQAKANLEGTRQDIMLEGITAYLNIISARERLSYAKRSENSLRKVTELEMARTKRGAGLSSDVLQARSQLAGAMARRVNAQGQLAIAKIQFKTVYKVEPSEEEIEGFFTPALPYSKIPDSMDKANGIAEQENPRNWVAEYDIKINEQELVSRKSRYYPKFNAFGQGRRKQNDDGIPGDRLEAYVGLELIYNLYRGGSDTASIREAVSNISESKNALINTQWQVRNNVKSAWQNYIIFKEQHKYLKEQADTINEFLKLAEKERKLGERSLLDILAAQVTYINSMSLAVSSEIDKNVAAYNLLHAMGRLTMGML